VRTAPHYKVPESAIGSLNNGAELGIDCWTTGDPDIDGHGYQYWMMADTGVADGYVNDWYLDTGGPNTWIYGRRSAKDRALKALQAAEHG
jgi:hypothetical protein